MGITADAVVVGAGVIGSSVAYELARRGRDVVVVDKNTSAGQGSTSASSAVVRFNYSTLDGVAAAWESLHCWLDWPNHLGADQEAPLASMVRTGVVMLDVGSTPRDRAMKHFKQVGVPFEEWDSAELRNRVTGIDAGRYWPPKKLSDPAFWEDSVEELGGLFTPDGGFIDDPMLAANNLASAAARNGTQFLYRQKVIELIRADRRVAGVRLEDGETIAAPIVVNCAGPWSSQLNALAEVGSDFTVTVRPMRQEVHHVRAPESYSSADHLGPVIADLDIGTYMRPAPGGMMMVGGTEPECDVFEWIDDPDLASLERTVASFESQITRAARRLPELRVPTQPKGIAGIYDVASDWTPIYDRTELDGFYVAMGTSGNQFKNAPIAGQMMASLIEQVESGHDHDLNPVRYKGVYTGLEVDMGAFSRKRAINSDSSSTVMG